MRLLALLGMVFTCVAGQAHAGDSAGDSAAHWRALTRMDVEGARKLLTDNHPAAVPEMGDTVFLANLDAGYRTALERADKTANYDGYVATLAGFSKALGDKHIWSRPVYTLAELEWAGVLVSRRGGAWVVSDEDVAEGAQPLKGYRVVACDGRAADVLAKEQLGGFRAYWPVEAQRIQTAPWLLVSENNPFVARPKACEFEKDGDKRTVTLTWRSAPRAEFLARIKVAAGRGAPGFGVRQFAGGWWISVQSLSDKAIPVVDAVRAQAADIRQGKTIVLDMRGNGGGNSAYGDQIAEALLGQAYIKAKLASEGEADCPNVWRASPGNLATIQDYKARFGERLGPEYVKEMTETEAQAKAALAAGRPFTGPISCKPAAKAPKTRKAVASEWPLRGKLVLLTDNACFSSCLNVTETFRRLGALHVGQTTDAATRYFEVREVLLPSGLSKFSTLQVASMSSPPAIGPFTPDRMYGGDITDTAALEAWVAAEAAK